MPKRTDSKVRKGIDEISPDKEQMARWLNSKQGLPSQGSLEASVVGKGGSSEEGESNEHDQQKGGEVFSEAGPVFEEARSENASGH